MLLTSLPVCPQLGPEIFRPMLGSGLPFMMFSVDVNNTALIEKFRAFAHKQLL